MIADLYIEPKDEVAIRRFFNSDLLPASEPGHVVKKIKTNTSKVVNKKNVTVFSLKSVHINNFCSL